MRNILKRIAIRLRAIIGPRLKRTLVATNFYPVYGNPLGGTPLLSFNMHDFFFRTSSFSQQGEDLTLDRILHRKLGIELKNYKGLYIDAGAYHPIDHSTSYLLYKRGWEGVCIDISKKSCEAIKKIRPRDHVVNAATSDVDGKIYFTDGPDISLVNEASETGGENDEQIDAFSLNSILKNLNICREIDYLNIDTEGAELKTMKGLDFKLFKPRVISVEIHAESVEEALVTDVAKYLISKGYKCVACNVITYFFIGSQ